MTLLFSALSLLTTAQTFDTQTLTDLTQHFDKDPVTYLKTETAPNYMLQAGGYTFDLKGVIGLYETRTPVSRVMSDVKIRQYGNMAIVSGTQKHSYTSKKDGTPTAFNEQFTYVFIYQEGKWLNAGGQHGQTPIEQK